jgi:hypothetical protein
MAQSGTAPHPEGTDREGLWWQCICPRCPTYTPCAGGARERLYCVVGRSPRCITEDLGCICPTCPVTEELGLKHLTFCLEGAEAEQSSSPPAR